MKQLSDHKVIRSVRRKLEVPTAPPEDTSVRSEDEVYDEECARLKSERVVLNESCSAKMLSHLRDSIHSDPESGLLYWVSRVFFSKDILRLEKNMRTYQSLSTLMSQIGRSHYRGKGNRTVST